MRKGRSITKTGLKSIMLLSTAFWLSSCGASSRSDVSAAAAGGIGAAVISLSASQVTVNSDNSDSTTITATVLDANNAVVTGVTVAFAATAGQISATTSTTDTNGQATVTFKSGTVDKSNATASITATVSGLSPVTIPIQIIGSTVTLSTDNTTITSTGSTTATLTITALDAGSVSVYNAPVSISSSGSGSVTLSQSSGLTDSAGQFSLTVTGASSGSVTVTVTCLGATATQDYTVSTPASAFGITVPATDPESLSTSGSLTVTVQAPSSSSVIFATTIGEWDGVIDQSYVTKPVFGGVVSAVLTSSLTGTANIQVYDANDSSVSDSITVAISAPSSEAANISLQSNTSILPLSLGSQSYTATLTATVRTTANQVVSGAPVAFYITNPTSGGETVSPVIVYSDSAGEASTTFTSGSLSSGNDGVTVTAEVIGAGITASANIVIGGTVGSVVIGGSTVISTNSENTAYIYPMSVLVADSNGNPMSGAVVTLKAWPSQYSTESATFDNEDSNKNLILDSGEDLNGDGALTPSNSAGGTIASSNSSDATGTVTTDASGVGNFNLTYLKASATWIVDTITATAVVQGTQTTSTLTFRLACSAGDDNCPLSSPYGP